MEIECFVSNVKCFLYLRRELSLIMEMEMIILDIFNVVTYKNSVHIFPIFPRYGNRMFWSRAQPRAQSKEFARQNLLVVLLSSRCL